MSSRLQDGIYYTSNSTPGKSVVILFLRINETSNAPEIGKLLSGLWSTCKDLEKGIVRGLEGQDKRHIHTGHLTTLIGYGPKTFTITDVRRKKPSGLDKFGMFNSPDINGGGSVISGSALNMLRMYMKIISRQTIL